MESQIELAPDRRNSNRRREHRYRCLRGARITFNAGFTVFDVTIRNISPSGALIEMETLLGIPKKFEKLLGYDESPRPCEVRWRTDQRMGVLFRDSPAAAEAA